MDEYTKAGIPNHGLIYTGGQLRKISKLLGEGRSLVEIGIIMGRKPSALAVQVGMIRKLDLFLYGADEDTITTMKKKKEEEAKKLPEIPEKLPISPENFTEGDKVQFLRNGTIYDNALIVNIYGDCFVVEMERDEFLTFHWDECYNMVHLS